MKLQSETFDGLPSGLVACFIGDEQMHAAGISPCSINLRTPSPIDWKGKALRLCFYQPQQGDYACFLIKNYTAGTVRRENGAVLSRFFFDDPACAAAIRRAMNDYARYVEIRSTEGVSAYGQAINNYPAHLDDLFEISAWMELFSALAPLPAAARDYELAVSLNCRELWQLYLACTPDDFLRAYANFRQIPANFLPARRPDRLYIGNPYCHHIMPEFSVLQAIADKARQEGIALTLVTAQLRAGYESRADDLFAFAAEHGLEVEINDWGMLHRAQAYRSEISLLLGTQLNRRRKDPRMPWKAGFPGREHLLERNSLNDELWVDFLHSMGIDRLEFESCGLPTRPPQYPCSLHLPFYQTNTSLWCPIRALCETGDRGMQSEEENCPRWCERNILRYPDHLKLIGRWNSLLALDAKIQEIPACFDRWVFNF